MQHISDNEFDRLFKDNLGEAEVQPSASLWGRIEPQISAKKRSRVPYLWMAAASVVVTLSAGLLFMQTDNQPVDVVNTAKIKPSIIKGSKPEAHKADVASNAGSSNAIAREKITGTDKTAVESSSEVISASVVENPLNESAMVKNEKSLIAMQPVPAEMHHTITTPDQEPEQVVGQVIATPEMETALAVTEKPAVALEEVREVEQPERARIRNAGDLVNFVVDKIDKREQKILEFKTDDDDNSSLIAINIGPFKLNQRKHK